MEELKDIKPNIDLINSGVIETILFGIIIILIGLFGYFLYRFFKRNLKKDKKRISKELLQLLDFDSLSDKQLAYQFTYHGYITVEEHFKDEFLKILKQLERFKYKKEVPKLDKDLKEQMKDYIKVRIR